MASIWTLSFCSPTPPYTIQSAWKICDSFFKNLSAIHFPHLLCYHSRLGYFFLYLGTSAGEDSGPSSNVCVSGGGGVRGGLMNFSTDSTRTLASSVVCPTIHFNSDTIYPEIVSGSTGWGLSPTGRSPSLFRGQSQVLVVTHASDQPKDEKLQWYSPYVWLICYSSPQNSENPCTYQTASLL